MWSSGGAIFPAPDIAAELEDLPQGYRIRTSSKLVALGTWSAVLP
jgi:hypothetical protein